MTKLFSILVYLGIGIVLYVFMIDDTISWYDPFFLGWIFAWPIIVGIWLLGIFAVALVILIAALLIIDWWDMRNAK